MEIISNKVYETRTLPPRSFDKDARGFNHDGDPLQRAHSLLAAWCVAGIAVRNFDPSAAENAGKLSLSKRHFPTLCVWTWDWSFFPWSYTYDCDSCGARF